MLGEPAQHLYPEGYQFRMPPLNKKSSINRLFEVAIKISRRGPRFAAAYFKEIVLFDLLNRTDTRGRKTNNNMSDENIYYVASFTSVAAETIDHARQALGGKFAHWQFVDIGSGKGKVVLVYAQRYGTEARHPPIGIEYDAKLAAIANANIAKLGFDRVGAKVQVDDARNIRAHVDTEGLVLFLYNPFFGSLFHEFISELASIPHMLIYVDPVEREYLLANGYTIMAEHKGRYNADTWVIAASKA